MRASTVELDETKPHRSAPVGLRLVVPAEAPPTCSPARPCSITALSQALSHVCHQLRGLPRTCCPDLLLRARPGLTWTPKDGLYNLCHVVPRDGPRTRTGASSGPSKLYSRGLVVVALTRSRSHISRLELTAGHPFKAAPPEPSSRLLRLLGEDEGTTHQRGEEEDGRERDDQGRGPRFGPGGHQWVWPYSATSGPGPCSTATRSRGRQLVPLQGGLLRHLVGARRPVGVLRRLPGPHRRHRRLELALHPQPCSLCASTTTQW